MAGDSITFGEPVLKSLSKDKRALVIEYCQRMLHSAAPKAVRFQKELLENEDANMKLRFMASESILNRVLGKATETINIGLNDQRPIVFSDKLQRLKEQAVGATEVIAKRVEDDLKLEKLEQEIIDVVAPQDNGVTIG
jgi:hypothetical protein